MSETLPQEEDDAILPKLEAIIRELFDDYKGPVTLSLTADDVEQWDSLGHIQLIVMIEQVWTIKFSNEEATTMADLGELISMIGKKVEV